MNREGGRGMAWLLLFPFSGWGRALFFLTLFVSRLCGNPSVDGPDLSGGHRCVFTSSCCGHLLY